MGFLYDSIEQARLRLHNTLVIYRDRLVWVGAFDVHDDNRIQAVDLLDAVTQERYNAYLDELDYTTSLNGYWTHIPPVDGDYIYTRYFCRVPSRQQRQGLHPENTMVCRWDDLSLADPDVRFGSRLVTDQFRKQLLLGHYPSVHDVLDMVPTFNKTTGQRSFVIALSRNTCIEYDKAMSAFTLIHLGKRIAISGDTKFKLPDKFRYLYETLIEEGIECH